MKQWIRLLCLSLLTMVTGMASAQDVAKVGSTEYATLQAAFNAATDGQTVTLLRDYNAANEAMAGGTRQFVINKSITLDGDGYTLTTKQRGIGIGNVNKDLSSNINVTIKDITIANTSSDARCIDTRGMISSLTLDGVTLKTDGATGCTQPLTIGGNQATAATVNITNSTIQTNNAATAYYAIMTYNPVNMTISNSTIKGWACIYAKGVDSSAGSAGSTFKIEGSNIYSSNAYSGVSNTFGAFVFEDNNITVDVTNSNLTITNTGDQYQTIAGSAEGLSGIKVNLGEGNNIQFVEPGNYAFKYNAVEIEITGGTYNFRLPAEILPEGYKCVDNGDGTYTVKEIEYVAQIGEEQFETLAAAVAAANAGDEIQIIKAGDYTLPGLPLNITVDSQVEGVVFSHTTAGSIASIPNGATFKNVTFDFGNVNYHGFQHAGTINMEGCTLNGKFFSYGDMNFTNCAFNQTNGDYHMWAYSGNLTYTGCSFTNSVTGKFLNIYNESGATKYTVTVEGCNFVNSGTSNKAALNVKATCGTKLLQYDVIINNCTTEGSFPSEDVTQPLAVLNNLVQVDDRTADGVDYITVTQDGVQIYPIVLNYVAQIGDEKYQSLQAAVNAAQQIGGSVTVNIISEISGETVTVNEVANFKLTIDGKKDDNSNYNVDAIIVVDGLRGHNGSITNGASVTLQNIAFVNGDHSSTQSGAIIQPCNYPHHLTIQDCTYSGSDTDASRNKWFIEVSKGPLYGAEIKNVTVEHSRLLQGDLALDVVFENITATNDIYSGFNIKTSGTLLIKDCQITTAKYALRDYKDNYVGTITLEGNTFTSTSEESDEGVIVNRGGEVGTTHINVVSGTYTGHVKVLNNKEGILVISGGYFSEEIPQDYIVEGKVCVTATDKPGYFTIGDPNYVAQIGDVKYESLQAALDAAEAANTENIVIDLLKDAELDITAWSGTKNPLAIGTADTKSITINGNNNKLTFNQKNSDWNNVATMNDEVTKLILNNLTITSAGYNNGPWNRHDINFNCAVELNNVTSDKALAFKNDATLNNVTISDTSGSLYGIWIQPNGQNISINGLNLTAERGIKIDDEYLDNPGKVTLNIANATFNTTKKSAILVKSGAETAITVGEGINIENVAADNVNVVWVDEDKAEDFYLVTVDGATVMPESKESDYVACLMKGEQRWGFYKGTNALANAIDKVEEGYSLKLHKTTTEAVEVSKPLTITKNGFTADNVTAGEGFVKEETDDEIIIREMNAVAQIGNVKYETLAAAVAAATEGANTIQLLKDIDLGTDFVNINKAVTIDGQGFTVTSSAAQAILLTGNGNVTISNTKVVASKGHGIQAGTNDAAYAGALTLNDNSILTVAKRGIRVFKEDTGFAINVENSTIQSNVQDPKSSYTTGDDAIGLSLGATDGKGYNVVINNSVIQGFSYCINNTTSGCNLNVTMTGGKTYGRAAVNAWGDNNNFTLDGVDVHGLNNQVGPTEAFACIVENNVTGVGIAENNNYTIKDCTFTATLSEAAMNTSSSSATEMLISLRGQNATVKVLGSTTYTCNSEERGGFIESEGQLMFNKLYFDDMAKNTFADAFEEAVISDVKEAEVNLYPVNYTPEVLYYWVTEQGNQGLYCKLAEPFTEGWLSDGEFIVLQKDVTLTENISCALTSGSFTLTLGENDLTAGDYSISLKVGVTVNTDKEVNVFSSSVEGYKVTCTATDDGYSYTLTEIGDESIELVDGEPYPYPEGKECTTVTYRRTFKESQVDKFQSWFVPFDYTVTEEDMDNFTFYKISMIAGAGEAGAEVEDESLVYIYITKAKVGDKLRANRPYVVKPNSALTDHIFKAENIEKVYAEDYTSRLKEETTRYIYNFYGNYRNTIVTQDKECMALGGGKIGWVIANSPLGSYRWYVKVTPRDENDDYSNLDLAFVEEDETNNISNVFSKDSEIDGIYTTGGIKIERPIKGINIIRFKNGINKKIYIK